MTHIGKYHGLFALARGGSGQLYKSYDPDTDRPVAIKVLVATNDERQLKRFREEARRAGKLNHPNVIAIYSSDVEDGVPYLVMEYLEGEDLAQRLSSGTPVPLDEAVEIMHQVAKGLDHVHGNGVVHRDVTPQNIWILPDGAVKVIDFGFAGSLQGTQGTRHAAGGTLHYMSPEHVEESEHQIDARSDIFSYGTVFYQLVCGQVPFAGDEDRNVILGILLHNPAPVRSLAPDCPEAVAQIIHRALQKDPKARFSSFKRLLFELDPIADEFRRQKAEALVAEGRRLLEEGQLDEAEASVERAMRSSKDYPPVRDLHREIQAALERRAERLRLEALLSQAEERLNREEFDAAIRLFEQARALDPTTEPHLRKARVAMFLWYGKRHLDEADFAEAAHCAREVLAAEEDNSEAIQLRDDVAAAVEKDRNRRLQAGLREARQCLRDKEFLPASILLDRLVKDFPEASELWALLSYAQDEVNARRRTVVRERTTAEVQSYAAYGQFDEALDAINTALGDFPDDPALLKLKYATVGGRAQLKGPGSEIPCPCGNLLTRGARFCDSCGQRLAG